MDEHVILEGDPATDSTRRHLERVLKGAPASRRQWGIALAAGGGTAWGLWRLIRAFQRKPDPTLSATGSSGGASERTRRSG